MKYKSEYKFDNINPKNSIGLLAPGNLDDMIEYAKTYIKGLPTSVTWDNLSLHGKEKLAEWIDGSMILISNDYEFEMITKKTGKAKNS